MKAHRLLYTILLCCNGLSVFASINSTDTLFPFSSLHETKRFVFQFVTQEYITNENSFYLDAKSDTCFIVFETTPIRNVMGMAYFDDEFGKNPWSKASSVQGMHYQLRFSDKGKIVELVNWKDFRDVLTSSISKQAQAKIISSSTFDQQKNLFNKESIIRRLVMEDVNYLFDLSEDSLREDAEYLRIKPIRSPFSGEDIFIRGTLSTLRPEGTRNTVKIFTKNIAGPAEKPILLEECAEYQLKNTDGQQPSSEIQRVGLNNEIEYQYNTAQKAMVRAVFSDIMSINFQSRGNIRIYTLWDIE